MREQTVVLTGSADENAMGWVKYARRQASAEKRTVHFYVVHPDTAQMYCVNCGLNIVLTNYGELALEAGSRAVNKESEKSCG
jgi:hypothetical protein